VSVKNQPFHRRFRCAIAGLVEAFREESSFRTHVLAGVLVLGVLLWRRPAPLWWALMVGTVALVFAFELVNTAVEKLADHLHPEQHSQIRIVKDCAAAAVLIASIAAVGIAVAFVIDQCR
jgi:undecaprenol kinase